MRDAGYLYVTPDDLRIGLYVDLEQGWMSHPFPMGSFKITSARQIETLREMGLARVRTVPARSDPGPAPDAIAAAEPDGGAPAGAALPAPPQTDASERRRDGRQAEVDLQHASLAYCDRQFDAAIHQYRVVIDCLAQDPPRAAALSQELVATLVGEMLGQGESSIRLLSESAGDRAWMHPVNVTVLSLLLGKALGMPAANLCELGLAAFLHDVGKTRLPARVRLADAGLAPGEYRQYQSHVTLGLDIARELGLPAAVQDTMGQHHEMMDGSGFPHQLPGAALSQGGKVLALVNRYDNMCNPERTAAAVTPHEALSLIFAQMKERHDATVLAAFIRMMGVYPPGSVVQLSDNRYALVVSVNSARPLKPRVMVHDPGISKEDALILDLEQAPMAGIRRSLRPELLPSEARDYLAPRLRICYFFERAADPVRGEIVP